MSTTAAETAGPNPAPMSAGETLPSLIAGMSSQRKFLILGVMACGQFMAQIDIQIVAASLGNVQAGLFNVMRNLGGAIGIAVVYTWLRDCSRLHASRFGDTFGESGRIAGGVVAQIAQRMRAMTPDPAHALQLARAEIGRIVAGLILGARVRPRLPDHGLAVHRDAGPRSILQAAQRTVGCCARRSTWTSHRS